MSIINLSNEGLELVNQFLDPGNLSEQIILLENIENSLQDMGYEEDDIKVGYNLYDSAYQAKQLRIKLQKMRAAVAGSDADNDD